MINAEVENFLKSLEQERYCTTATLANYRSTYQQFYNQHDSLTLANVREFLKGYSNPASVNVVKSRLNSLAESLEISLAKLPRAKEPTKEVEALTLAECVTLAVEASKLDKQLGLIVTVLYTTGLRIHEFHALTPESIEYREGLPHLKVFGKGRKHRTVPLGPTSLAALKQLEFPCSLSDRSLRTLLRQAGRKAGLPYEVHPHLLRASWASIMLNEQHWDSTKLCKVGGWSSADTLVKHYFKPSLESLHTGML